MNRKPRSAGARTLEHLARVITEWSGGSNAFGVAWPLAKRSSSASSGGMQKLANSLWR